MYLSLDCRPTLRGHKRHPVSRCCSLSLSSLASATGQSFLYLKRSGSLVPMSSRYAILRLGPAAKEISTHRSPLLIKYSSGSGRLRCLLCTAESAQTAVSIRRCHLWPSNCPPDPVNLLASMRGCRGESRCFIRKRSSCLFGRIQLIPSLIPSFMASFFFFCTCNVDPDSL